ncbi:hypothetical protein Tco_1154224 [Tanacetum coccineum]
METCDPVGTLMEIKDRLDLDQNGSPVDATKYRSMIGALMHLTSSRPYIVHATCLCARYQAKPTEKHFKEDSGFKLTGFSDADYAGCKDTFKSTSGGAQFLGEKLVRWSSKKQDCTALSTMEAEYVSLSTCCAQVLWMRTQLTDYGFYFNKILIYCDSKLALAISYNPVQHSRTKHIAVRYHFIKEHVVLRHTWIKWVQIENCIWSRRISNCDLFTKALPVDRIQLVGSSPWHEPEDLSQDHSLDRVDSLGLIEKRTKDFLMKCFMAQNKRFHVRYSKHIVYKDYCLEDYYLEDECLSWMLNEDVQPSRNLKIKQVEFKFKGDCWEKYKSKRSKYC